MVLAPKMVLNSDHSGSQEVLDPNEVLLGSSGPSVDSGREDDSGPLEVCHMVLDPQMLLDSQDV